MAYTVTTTLVRPTALRIGERLGLVFGRCDINTYSTTLAQITSITGKFADTSPRVYPAPITDNGYFVVWSSADRSFKVFDPNANWKVDSTTIQAEAEDGKDVGAFDWIAIGLV